MTHPRCHLAFTLIPLRLGLALLALTGLLVACGEREVQAEAAGVLTLDARGTRYLALADGEGEWQLLSSSPDHKGLTSVKLSDPQGRYGVMSVCLDESSGAVSVQVKRGVLTHIQGGTAPTSTASLANAVRAAPVPALSPVRLRCDTPEVPQSRTEVRGPIRGLLAGEYGGLYLGNASALIDASSPVSSLEMSGAEVPDTDASTLDLVATRYAPDARLPRALIVEVLEPTPGRTTPVELDFASQQATPLTEAEIPLRGQRPNELLSGSVELVTPSGTRALLGEAVSGSDLSYARPPKTLLKGAALYAEAQSFAYNDRTKAGSSRSVSRTFRAGAVAPLTLPPPLELQPPTLPGRAGVLLPRVSWTVDGAAEGDYTLFYSQVRSGHSVSYRFSQSLGASRLHYPEATSLSQTLPDFSELPGWQAEWNLVRGEDLFWDVSLRTDNEGNATSSSRSGVLPTD